MLSHSVVSDCDPMDYSPPDSSVHGILLARILEWVAISSSRGSSQRRDWSCVSWISCVDRRLLHNCTAWEAQVTLWRQIGQNVLWVGGREKESWWYYTAFLSSSAVWVGDPFTENRFFDRRWERNWGRWRLKWGGLSEREGGVQPVQDCHVCSQRCLVPASSGWPWFSSQRIFLKLNEKWCLTTCFSRKLHWSGWGWFLPAPTGPRGRMSVGPGTAVLTKSWARLSQCSG